jgi:hypothetical protein
MEETMIRNVNKFTREKEFYECVPSAIYNAVDIETNELLEDGVIKDGIYYIFHNGKVSDKYQRVVNLKFVDVCETDLEDDLSVYGFKLIRQMGVWKRWAKQ